MPRYALFHPDTEMLGQVILDFERAIGSRDFWPLLDKHGLTHLEAPRWYPAQPWVDVLNEVAATPTGMFNLVAIGIRQLELAQMPLEFNYLPLRDVLSRMDDAYRMNYRGTDIGEIRTDILAEDVIRMTVRTFEPDDLWFGNIHGMMRRFAPHKRFTVTIDPSTPRNAEDKEHTIFHIRLGQSLPRE